MGRDRRSGDDDQGFADAVGPVRPMRGRDRIRPPPEGERRATPVPRAPRRWRVEQREPALSARAEDVSRATLAELRRGRIPPDRELDLHGLDLTAARRTLDDAVAAARRDGLRCLLVIHGRGRHSPGRPVLREAVAEWLLAEHRTEEVRAVAPAPPGLGGSGACLVLLRRS